MSGNKLFYFFGLLVFGLMLWILWNSLSLTGVKDLKGNFKEAALYRNENNTGPITRIYAVTLNDSLWQEMKQYGDFMPYTKYGTTKVYFFLEASPIPDQLTPGQQNFDQRYQKYCLALYLKNNMGQTSFIRHPFIKE